MIATVETALSSTRPVFLNYFTAIFPDNAVSAKLAVDLGICACLAFLQARLAVTVFIFLTIEYGLFFWMKAAMISVDHGGCSLLKKSPGVKLPADRILTLSQRRDIPRDRFGELGYNLASFHPERTRATTDMGYLCNQVRTTKSP